MMWVSVAAAVLLGVILVQLLRLNRQLARISKNVRDYMEAVCQEEKPDRLDVSLTPEEKKILFSASPEDDEKVFNEVLKELFQ